MFSLIVFSSALVLVLANSKPPFVQISSGLIEGQLVQSTIINKSYYSFRGIPYAEPPVGKLRFQPPVKPKPWTNTLETKADGSPCVQNSKGSEDCLFINVYTPLLPSDGDKSKLLPVIFYIHGGAYVHGSSNSSYLGPEYLVDKNVILVTMNYRLNVFGFLNAMEESAPGNAGLKDTVAALEWVHENIEKFNGDPNLVTIAGHSAGSGSVQYLLQSKLAKGLFHGAIMQSGSSINTWALETKPVDLIHKLGDILNINSANITELVEKLKEIPSNELFEASINPSIVDKQHKLVRERFIPSLEHDSPKAFVTENSITVLSENKINSVPIMMGYVMNEAIFFLDDIESGKIKLERYENDPKLVVPESLNIFDDEKSLTAVRNEIVNHYFKDKSINNVTEFLIFQSDQTFVRGIRKSLELLRKHNDIYFYVYGYKDKNDHSKYPGVGHVAELKYLFYTGAEESTEDKVIREKMTTLWTNFAKTGNPTPNTDPLLDNIKWPIVSRTSDDKVKYLKIEENLEINENPGQENFVFWEGIYKKYGKAPIQVY